MEKIVLRSIGANEIAVVKDIRDLLCIDLYKAKEVVEMVKNGDEFEMVVNDAKFAVDILLSSGADAYILDIEDEQEEPQEQNEELQKDQQKHLEEFQRATLVEQQEEWEEHEGKEEYEEYEELGDNDDYEDNSILTGNLLDDLIRCRDNLQEGTNISNERFHVLEQIYNYQKKLATAKSGKWFLIVIPFLMFITSEDTVMLTVFFFFLFLIIYLLIIRPIQCVKADNKYVDLILELKQEIPEYDKMIEEWQNTPVTQTCMEFMTEKYWNLEALDTLISLVEGKRAETFKEAINLYEDIQHQNRMEAMQQEQLSVSRDTNKRISSIQQTAANTERYAKKAAHSAKVGNVINAVNTVQLHNISKHTKK